MKRLFEIGAFCALSLVWLPAEAMPLGVRTLLHAHAVARQQAVEPLPEAPAFDVHGGNWTRLSDGSWKSGETADGATNSLSMTVNGSGTVSFRWKVSCEDYFIFRTQKILCDHLIFLVDSEARDLVNGDTGWTNATFTVEGEGEHKLTWAYIKDSEGAAGEDCAWVDAVVWAPAGLPVDAGDGKTVAVPQSWITGHPALVVASGGDAATALLARAENGRKVWECFVLGLDPEDAEDDFKITSFPINADGTPNLDGITISPPQARWNVEGATPVLKGRESLFGGAWQTVTDENKAQMRFFKVEVALP